MRDDQTTAPGCQVCAGQAVSLSEWQSSLPDARVREGGSRNG